MKVNVISETGIILSEFDVIDGNLDYVYLVTVIQENFPHAQNYFLQWKDMDGDFITFSSQEELNEAVSFRAEEDLNIYIQETSDKISSTDEESEFIEDSLQQDIVHRRHPHRIIGKCRKSRKAMVEKSPDSFPNFFSVSKIPCKIKRRLKRCDRKRLRRHGIRGAKCYPRQKRECRRRKQRDEDLKTLASLSISDDP
ncbi:uncharacterized protein LOC125663650 [Ostrea edulis]|uniref:uncharacterized protein LOC125663650 n=1 Tax=Ostrea edulis TaxID=37623 RepID=UPI0020944E68|nr:uncharacterized protein LOC125663650 [Ostrea edulis]